MREKREKRNERTKFYSGDIETQGGLEGKFLMGGVYDGKTYRGFTNERDFMNFVLKLKGTIFFHFLDFDIRFILDWCQRNGVEVTTMPILSGDKKVVEWRIEDVVFRDSLILTNSSLRELAKTFRLRTKKIEVGEYRSLKNTKKTRQYLQNDVIILHKILVKFYDFVGWKNFKKRTVASLSLEKYKEIDRNSYDKITEYPIYRTEEEFLRRGYFSGYYWVQNTELSNANNEILKIDVNSYYPFSMIENKFPWGRIIRVSRKDEIMEMIETRLGIIQAKATVPPQRGFGFLPVKTKEGVEYPNAGKIAGVWTSAEIQFAKKIGYTFEFERAIFFPHSAYLFRKYIKTLNEIKTQSAGAKREIAKTLMVSFYGKFAQKRDILLLKRTEFPEPGRFYMDDRMSIVEEKRYVRTPYSHPEISIFTTAYARIFMYRVCQEIGFENVHAVMHDSIIFDDVLTGELKRRWFHEKQIGKFKIVSKLKRGLFLGRGVYALVGEDGDEIIRNQGGLAEFRGSMKFQDFEKIYNSGAGVWKQYANLKRPKTIYSVLKGGAPLRREYRNNRKMKLKKYGRVGEN